MKPKETFEPRCRHCGMASDSMCGCNRCDAIRHSWFCDRFEEKAYEQEKELTLKMERRKYA